MTAGLAIVADDPAYKTALRHPKSTPAIRRRVLQRVAVFFAAQSDLLGETWSELPEHEHAFWIKWATDSLPKPNALQAAAGAGFVALTLLNIILHRDDAVEMLTAARALRLRILDLRAREVWDAASADPDFQEASRLGFEDIEAGRVSVVALKDL